MSKSDLRLFCIPAKTKLLQSVSIVRFLLGKNPIQTGQEGKNMLLLNKKKKSTAALFLVSAVLFINQKTRINIQN